MLVSFVRRVTLLLVVSFHLLKAFPLARNFPRREGTTTSFRMAQESTSEVVGASGRMGTFFVEHQDGAFACPRGTTPGSRSTLGCPIYVATPSDAYESVYEAAIANRRQDLVFAGNAGLPIDDRFGDCTILVPHFSVLWKGQWKGKSDKNESEGNPSSSERRIQVNTDPLVSPPTYIYGKHAVHVASVLEASGIASRIVPSFSEIKAYSGRKLIWASCFWLLCHTYSNQAINEQPLTVGQVHEFRQHDLERLVDEILPSLQDWLLLDNNNGSGKANAGAAAQVETDAKKLEKIIDRTRVLQYLRAYSESISGAVPSVDLAKQEFQDRNAVWLRKPENKELRNRHKQPFHLKLLDEMGLTNNVGDVFLC